MFHLIYFICSLLHLTIDILNFYTYKDLQYWTKWLEDKILFEMFPTVIAYYLSLNGT